MKDNTYKEGLSALNVKFFWKNAVNCIHFELKPGKNLTAKY